MGRKDLEIDFVCNLGQERFYIQSALYINDEEKLEQEEKSLINVDDSFKEIIVTIDMQSKPRRTENGTLILSLKDFLLDESYVRFMS